MLAFATVLDELSFTQSRNGKLALLEQYFRVTPDPARGWALAALTDGLPLRFPMRRIISDLMAERIDPVLFKLSRDYVGDTAETVALLWPDTVAARVNSPALHDVVASFRSASPAEMRPLLAGLLDQLDVRGRWALLKLLGGAPRVGVSARLARTALAAALGKDLAEIEELWHGLTPPYLALFQWADGAAQRPDAAGLPVFRPLMLAPPIEEPDWIDLKAEDFAAEWKWDGIRVQIAAAPGGVRIFSRNGDDISPTFPEIASAFVGRHVTVDGELLVLRDGVVAPFNDLQQRLNRKTVTPKQLRDYPAHVRLYDVLFIGTEDVRTLPFAERRKQLEAWCTEPGAANTDVSERVPFADFAELAVLRDNARAAGIEGLMLKRLASPYLAGRPKGHWYKWKRDPLMLDCVLMYAQRGSGKRSSFYSDYTFGVWRPTADGARELAPVGKAYSGFTDAELKEVDRFIRSNTMESFGPVRSVAPELVLEVAFDAVQRSSRHKSGVAMRFPRIHRIRWDKPAAEADTLEAVLSLIPTNEPS